MPPNLSAPDRAQIHGVGRARQPGARRDRRGWSDTHADLLVRGGEQDAAVVVALEPGVHARVRRRAVAGAPAEVLAGAPTVAGLAVAGGLEAVAQSAAVWARV